MFRDPSSDPGQHAPKIELVQPAELGLRRQRHVEDHEAAARLEHAGRFAQPSVEIHQVPQSPTDHRAVEGAASGNGSARASAVDRRGRADFAGPAGASRCDEVGADDPAAEPGLPREGGPEVQRPGAEVEVDSLRPPLPPQPPHRVLPPALIKRRLMMRLSRS